MSDPLDDGKLEAFLRRFEPRAPSPLPVSRRRARRVWWSLAAAVLLATGVWLGWDRAPRIPEEPPSTAALRPRPTMGGLSVVLRPGESGRVMAELEGHVLADPRRAGGALRRLAVSGPEI